VVLRSWRLVATLFAISICGPLPIHAQSHAFLSADHWMRGALRRLALTGEVDAVAAALSWPATQIEIASWLNASASGSGESAPFYRDLFTREVAPDRRLHARLSLGGRSSEGELRAGTMLFVPERGYVYPGPVSEPDHASAVLHGAVSARLTDWVAVGIEGGVREREERLDAAYLSARFGPIVAWAGRRAIAFGHTPGESLVLNGTTTFDGFGVGARDGFRAPWVGRVFPEISLARLPRSGDVRHPLFHSMRITLAPSPSLAIGLNRAVIFGGDENFGVTPIRVLFMLIGLSDVAAKDSDFENQVASVDVLWRTRLGDWPLGLYAEIGAEDSGWGFAYVPGIVAGAELAELPAWPELALGVEVVHIDEHCCTYPPWYQHGALADGWTDRGRLLGHPLGGAGTQLTLYGRADLPRVPMLTNARLSFRNRAPENLFSPVQQGGSFGGEVGLLMPWRRAQLELRGRSEHGRDGWRSTDLRVQANLFVR
jgi:hypothetical protein